ncbi:MAG: GNAT family N-acetyltransferase [Aeromicrobium sp.]|uniref:GNAT family N-acetyltransferase n=1 Tax=Aeromicrobium sp. TaxID=1871063 RepID=UPI0039E248B9
MTLSPDRSVRLGWADDAVALASIQRHVWTGTWVRADQIEEAFGDLDEHAARWSATLTAPQEARFRVLVALDGPRPRGYVVVHPGADPDADPATDAEIGDLAVDPDARRVGHGSRLVQAAVDTAVADGFTLLRMWLPSTDDATRALLVSSGWSPDGAHRELEAPDGRRLPQVRLHTQIA